MKMEVWVDISKALCSNCERPMLVSGMVCRHCDLRLEGTFEIAPLARLSLEDQAFVSAFVRYHGSIKKMEELFDISYPTVKNRLNAITAALERSTQSASPNAHVLEQLARGAITVDEALARMK